MPIILIQKELVKLPLLVQLVTSYFKVIPIYFKQFTEKIYDKLTAPTPEEEDLLDLAYGLTQTSRLGCQVKVTKEFENALITLPKATRNFYVDGHKPKPH